MKNNPYRGSVILIFIEYFQNVTATQIAWGLCLPDSCLPADAAVFLASATGHKVSVRAEMCTGEARETPMSALELLFVCAIGGFVSVVLFCTFYKAHLMGKREDTKRSRPSTGEELIGAFSVTENLKKLNCVGSDDLGLSCVNGIKAIAMLLIVSGHSLIFVIGGPVKNSEFYEKVTLYWAMSICIVFKIVFLSLSLYTASQISAKRIPAQLTSSRGHILVAQWPSVRPTADARVGEEEGPS